MGVVYYILVSLDLKRVGLKAGHLDVSHLDTDSARPARLLPEGTGLIPLLLVSYKVWQKTKVRLRG